MAPYLIHFTWLLRDLKFLTGSSSITHPLIYERKQKRRLRMSLAGRVNGLNFDPWPVNPLSALVPISPRSVRAVSPRTITLLLLCVDKRGDHRSTTLWLMIVTLRRSPLPTATVAAASLYRPTAVTIAYRQQWWTLQSHATALVCRSHSTEDGLIYALCSSHLTL